MSSQVLRRDAVGRRCVAVAHGLALTGLAIGEALLLLWVATCVVLVVVGVGVLLLPGAWAAVLGEADRQRRLATRWSGVEVVSPHGPAEPPGPGLRSRWRWLYASLGDRAVWRDVLWSLVNPFVGPFMAFLPTLAIVHGLWGIVLLAIWRPVVSQWENSWYLFVPLRGESTAIVSAVLGVVEIVVGVWIALPLLRLHGRWVDRMLGRPSSASLVRRVDVLSQSRSDTVERQAAELRRIERDLHDGAQVRLVAMGMTLTAASHLVDDHPEAARALLLEARDSSVKALSELRELVRGIHPPVLADRGLVDAVRALAMDMHQPVEVRGHLPERPPAPVEAAVYFAVSELLTNVGKHADAGVVTVDLSSDGDSVRAVVHDDGAGGADVAAGSGLRGIEQRLAAFDGSLTVASPVGGPTTMTLDVPCHTVVGIRS